MKKHIITLISITFLLTSCSFFKMPESDSKIFNDYKPIEWSDDYIFATTWYPQQIQVWDKKTGKCVHIYSFVDNEKKRYMDIDDIVILDKKLWMIGSGYQSNLIRFDITTGKLEYIDVGFKPESLELVKEANEGRGVVVVSSYSVQGVGCKIKIFDSEKNVLQSYNVNHKDIAFSNGVKNIFYKDNNYYLLAGSHDYCDFSNLDESCYKLITLFQNGEVKYSTKTLKDFFTEDIMKSLPVVNKKFLTGIELDGMNKQTKSNYVSVSLINSQYDWKLIYELSDIDTENYIYTGIKYIKNESKTVYDITNKNEHTYWTGRLRKSEFENFNGLEIAVYPQNGGEREKRVLLKNANQLYKTNTENEIWFSKDIDYGEPAMIYNFDIDKEEVRLYKSDGTYKVLPWICD